jgi:DNA invertase Pin-like site-specific DNA recombinase
VRAALYARVSTEEQVEGYSLDAQKRAFNTLIQGRGWTVYHEYIEEGRSAHTDDINKRPIFKEAMEDALAKKYDVLVVHKIDRFSRKLKVTLECFEKLGKAGIGFVSIENQIDYSTSMGKLMLVMQSGLAEFYSDNLSTEVKKGMGERKKQGLYCGSLPFGMIKGEDGVPIPDPATFPHLKTAFEQAAQGKTDREIAVNLNAQGQRTTGSRGNNPFANSSVRGILTNPFYIGQLPDGKGGYIQAKHKPLIEQEIWDAAQDTRRRNRTSTQTRCPIQKKANTLTGIAYCWYCKGKIHTHYHYLGEPRLGCYNRAKDNRCCQKSANLSVYEAQLLSYLSNFHIPEDYQQRILHAQQQLEKAYVDSDTQKVRLERQLKRARELYEWGDSPKAEYEIRRDTILDQLRSLTVPQHPAEHLEKMAKFLADVPSAWVSATPDQRSKLAQCLFEQVWLKDKEVVAVKPLGELEPFFRLNYEEFTAKNIEHASSSRIRLLPKHGISNFFDNCIKTNAFKWIYVK